MAGRVVSMEPNITNNAPDIPFSFILEDLLSGTVEQSREKQAVYRKMEGIAAIEVPDIEAAVSLHFRRGSLTIEPGVSPQAKVIIRTSSENVMSLNALTIRCGLPCYFDEAGRRVLGLLFTGALKIRGLFTHPVFLTRLTVIMSVM